MPQINIRKTHPQFYWVLIGLAVTLISIGLLCLLVPVKDASFWYFVSPFFIIPAILLYGIFSYNYRFVRIGLILGTLYISFFAYAFIGGVARGAEKVEVKELAWLVPPWVFMALVFALSVKEPPSNSDAQAQKILEHNGKIE